MNIVGIKALLCHRMVVSAASSLVCELQILLDRGTVVDVGAIRPPDDRPDQNMAVPISCVLELVCLQVNVLAAVVIVCAQCSAKPGELTRRA